MSDGTHDGGWVSNMKNIVLIGISGSGKTYFGNRLAEKLSKKFLDLDTLISKNANLSIKEIFKNEGEEGFRRRESQTIRDISGLNNKIIATGGGAVLTRENMDCLSRNGTIIFLDRPVEDILGSVEMSDRPLLKDNPEKLKDIYSERLPLYNKYADFVIGGDPCDEVMHKLIHISTLGETEKSLAVIGDPIGHSLSPPIHLGAIGPLVKKLVYEKVEVKKGMLFQWIKTDGRMKLDGFNVTMPHKEGIIPLLDIVDCDAERIGAVNTVVNREGMLKGYSTDGKGFSSALKSYGACFSQSTVTIIGSGGAAKTIAMKAAKEGARRIHIVARNTFEALKIRQMIKNNYSVDSDVYPFSIENIRGEPWESNIVINTTPLGMKGSGVDFVNYQFLEGIRPGALICDIVYSTERTRLTLEAEVLGLKTMEGIDMLIEQALAADDLFLNAEIGKHKARKRARKHLEGGPVI